jgi:hypothetical protein
MQALGLDGRRGKQAARKPLLVLAGKLAQALGAKPSLVYFYLLIPVVNLIGMVPSLGGLGPREGAYALLLKDVIGAEQAIALSLLSLSVLFMFSVIGGIIYFVRSDYHFKFKEIKSPKTELL